MPLHNFLRTEVAALELCVIRLKGWIVATCWIDYEDLFIIPKDLSDLPVQNDSWGTLPIADQSGNRVEVPCHFIDV